MLLIPWHCWYVDTLRCHRHKVNGAFAPTNALKTSLWMWRVKASCEFRPWFSGGLWRFMWPKKWFLIHTQLHWFYEDNIKWRTWKTYLKKTENWKRRTTYPRYAVRMLNWFHLLSSYGKNTKHCETEWKMAFFKIATNELELRSGEPQASSPYIYIYMYNIPVKIYIYIYITYLYIYIS